MYVAPMTMGRSASPARNTTITSIPTRGMNWNPHPVPAHALHGADPARAVLVAALRAIPVELDLDAAVLVGSVWISCPAGPVTMAVSITCWSAAAGAWAVGHVVGHAGEAVLVDVARAGAAARHLGVVPLVLDADHRVPPVERRERVAREREPLAGRQAAAAALAPGHRGARAVLLEVARGGGGVDGAALELAVVIVDAEPGPIEAPLGPRVSAGGVEIERGADEVEVREQRRSGGHAPRHPEAAHVAVELGHPARVAEDELGGAGDGRAQVDAVTEDDHLAVLIGRVLERVEDALLREQAPDEAEIALLVLHAVGARRVGAHQTEDAVHLVLGEDRSDDLAHRPSWKMRLFLPRPSSQRRGAEPDAEAVAELAAARDPLGLDAAEDAVDGVRHVAGGAHPQRRRWPRRSRSRVAASTEVPRRRISKAYSREICSTPLMETTWSSPAA